MIFFQGLKMQFKRSSSGEYMVGNAGNSYLSHRFIDSFPRIIKKYKIKTSFGSLRANETSIDIMNFILIFVENCL